MNQTHLHLLVNHLPIFGSVFAAFVLAYGLWAKSNSTKMAAYYLLIISAVGAGIAYLTGEAAEESVENIAGVSHDIIEQHEEFSLFALLALIAAGLISLIGLFITARKSKHTRAIAMTTLVIALISFVLVARTGYIGGLIRHTEIYNTIENPVEGNTEDEHD